MKIVDEATASITATATWRITKRCIRKLAFLAGGHGYVLSQAVTLRKPDGGETRQGKKVAGYRDTRVPVVLRNDGRLYAKNSSLHHSDHISDLPFTVEIPSTVDQNKILSMEGIERYRRCHHPPTAKSLFERAIEVVRTFIPLRENIDSPEDVRTLIAVYGLSTYLHSAYASLPHLWGASNDMGTLWSFGQTLEQISCLGRGENWLKQPYANVRETVESGATIVRYRFDAADPAYRTNPMTRSLIETGLEQGVPVAARGRPKRSEKYPRRIIPSGGRVVACAHDALPPMVDHSIVINLNDHPMQCYEDVLREELWPFSRREFVDDCWLFTLERLKVTRRCFNEVVALSRLPGLRLEPWRSLLATTLLLERDEEGVPGLFEKMDAIATRYEVRRPAYNFADVVRHLVRDLFSGKNGNVLEVLTSELLPEVEKINLQMGYVSPTARIAPLLGQTMSGFGCEPFRRWKEGRGWKARREVFVGR